MVRRGPQTFRQIKIIDKNKLNKYIEPRFKKWTRAISADDAVCSLAPIPGDVDVASAARNPPARNPHNPSPRRVHPASRDPDVPRPTPAIVSGHQHPPRMQRWSWPFNDNGRRGTGVNDDLCACCACGQCKPAHCYQNALFQAHKYLQNICRLRETERVAFRAPTCWSSAQPTG